MRGLPAVRVLLPHPRSGHSEKSERLPGKLQLEGKHHAGDLQAGQQRRRAALLHGVPQGNSRILGQNFNQRFSGDESTH